MFQMTVGRSAIGLSLAVCIFWVSWTQGHQNRENYFEPGLPGEAIVLPTGFLPTKPLGAAKAVVIDISAENLTGYGSDRSSYVDFLAAFDLNILAAFRAQEKTSTAKFSAVVDFGGVSQPPDADSADVPMALEEDLARAAADLFGAPFNALFSSLFQGSGTGGALFAGQEDQNPFTQAKEDSSSKASSMPAGNQTQTDESDESSKQQTSLDAMQASGNPNARFLFLGDWDGSGTLQAADAARIDEATFAFADGRKTFNLYISPTAVEQQRSLAVEDVDGNGIPDLLVTAGGSLFGGVYAGDADGGFSLADTFVTGYEPMLAAVGPFYGTKREIITFNTRSGAVATYRFADRLRVSKRQNLDFMPGYVAHLVDQNQGTDHILAAELGQAARTYQILDDGTLLQSVDGLPCQPSMSIGRDFLGKGGLQGLLEVFQIGLSASIVLSNANGETYNVANLHVSSQIFVVIGDLDSDGTVDVGVARLK